jgi:hypothetical protein
MAKLVELELYTDAKPELKISLDPDFVAAIEDLPENGEACKIVCKDKSEYIVVGARDLVAKKINRARGR